MFIYALRKVFRNPQYVLLAFITSLAVFVFAIWLPNIPLVVMIMGHSGAPFAQRFNLLISLLGSIATNFTPFSVLYTIAIAILFGTNLAMTTYYLRRRTDEMAQGGVVMGFFGIASGTLGIGCAACGSLVLTNVLSVVGVSGILSFLPFAGGEFGILGAILLGASLYMMAKKIKNPVVCKIYSHL